jgi:ribosomal protein S21
MKIVVDEVGGLDQALKLLSADNRGLRSELRRRSAYVGPAEARRLKSRFARRRVARSAERKRRLLVNRSARAMAERQRMPKSYSRADLIANRILMPRQAA